MNFATDTRRDDSTVSNRTGTNHRYAPADMTRRPYFIEIWYGNKRLAPAFVTEVAIGARTDLLSLVREAADVDPDEPVPDIHRYMVKVFEYATGWFGRPRKGALLLPYVFRADAEYQRWAA